MREQKSAISSNLFAAGNPAQRKTCEVEVSDSHECRTLAVELHSLASQLEVQSHGRRYTKFRIDRDLHRIIVEMEATK